MSPAISYHPPGFNGPRIVGVETEYGVVCTPAVRDCHEGGNVRASAPDSSSVLSVSSSGRHARAEVDSSQAASLLFADVTRRWGCPATFCHRGGRLYLDVGDHPEYATAECLSLPALLQQIRWGDHLLAGMLMRAQQELDGHGRGQRIHVLKTNADSWGHSFGCHENYMVGHHLSGRDHDVLATHLILRTLWCSTGAVTSSGWRRSARAPFLHHVQSSTTTRSRPLINTRDEAHADPERFGRLHVISADSTMTQAPVVLAVGSTMLLLAALERGMQGADLMLSYPMQALRDLHDEPWHDGKPLGTTLVHRQCGRSISAIDLAASMYDRVETACRGVEITGMDDVVFDLWKRSITACQTGQYDSVRREWEWLTTLRLCERVMDRHHCSWDSPLVQRTILAFHDIGDQGLLAAVEQSGDVRTFEREINDYYASSHQGRAQRAVVRGRIVRAAEASGSDVQMGWTMMRVPSNGTGEGITLGMMDPWSVDSERVDEFLQCVNHRLPPPPHWA